MWRLMAMIMVMSDTGSVSLVATHTDWPDETSCRQILQSHYTPPPPTEFNGHMATAKISASCIPVGLVAQADVVPPPLPRQMLPPEIELRTRRQPADFFRPMFVR
jgi:hypothetical protein